MDRVIGPLLVVTGIGHALVGAVLFSDPLAAIMDAGFINAIEPPSYADEPHFDRIAAFWFLVFSPILVLLGQLTSRAVRRSDAHTLYVIACHLLAIGIVGVVVLPVSGNWFLIVLGALILQAGRHVSTKSGSLDQNDSVV